jgi:hypothetical protein
MKRFIIALLLSATFFTSQLKAYEGMWLLPLLETLNYETMQGIGLELTPEQIYSINNSSLKDAIAIFGSGCTSEIISKDGLLLTNHHCGYGEIQSHTTLEKDVLGEGFWARSREEELPNEGLSVSFLIRIEDVTDAVLADVSDKMEEQERLALINSVADSLKKKAVEGTHFTASVRSFFDNNHYYLFVFEVFRDVRLVGTPPESIGKFGHDTDNWMWPRHTGDFSLFRVYTGPDGKPADYAEENIPLKPKHHLPVSLKGVEEGDFSMILGFPGRTDRYMSSFGIEELMEVTHPNRIKIRGVRQEILKEDMAADKEVYNKYASKFARSSNYWKYSIGQSKGIKRLNVVDRKKAEEAEFQKMVNTDENLKSRYGSVLVDIENYYKESRPLITNLQALSEVYRSAEIMTVAGYTLKLSFLLDNPETSQEEIDAEIAAIKGKMLKFFKDYNRLTDMKVTKAMLGVYAEIIPASQQPAIYETIRGKYKNDYNKYVDYVFSKTLFADQESTETFLASPSLKTLQKDPAFLLAKSFNYKINEVSSEYQSVNIQLKKARRLYTEARLKLEDEKRFYPDANFTMRLTYGSIGGYSPADGVHYDYITELSGVMEKEGPANGEFEVPEKLKKLFESKDYGRYGVDGKMPVCFTSNNDITGGNSGSPVINGKGELIGLAFDGNWEAMSGDIVFEDKLQKTISVDIRYVLFIIDKYAGAANLIEEMTIVE